MLQIPKNHLTGSQLSINRSVVLENVITERTIQFLGKKLVCDVKFLWYKGRLLSMKLTSSSNYSRLLSEDDDDSLLDIAKQPSSQVNSLLSLIGFYHTGNLEINKHNIEDIFDEIDYLYDVGNIDAYYNYLESLLDSRNCLHIQKAIEYWNVQLKIKVNDFIFSKFEDVSSTREFLTISYEQFLELLKSRKADNRNEDNMFRTIRAWVNHKPKMRKVYEMSLLEQLNVQDLCLKNLFKYTKLLPTENKNLMSYLNLLIETKKNEERNVEKKVVIDSTVVQRVKTKSVIDLGPRTADSIVPQATTTAVTKRVSNIRQSVVNNSKSKLATSFETKPVSNLSPEKNDDVLQAVDVVVRKPVHDRPPKTKREAIIKVVDEPLNMFESKTEQNANTKPVAEIAPHTGYNFVPKKEQKTVATPIAYKPPTRIDNSLPKTVANVVERPIPYLLPKAGDTFLPKNVTITVTEPVPDLTTSEVNNFDTRNVPNNSMKKVLDLNPKVTTNFGLRTVVPSSVNTPVSENFESKSFGNFGRKDFPDRAPANDIYAPRAVTKSNIVKTAPGGLVTTTTTECFGSESFFDGQPKQFADFRQEEIDNFMSTAMARVGTNPVADLDQKTTKNSKPSRFDRFMSQASNFVKGNNTKTKIEVTSPVVESPSTFLNVSSSMSNLSSPSVSRRYFQISSVQTGSTSDLSSIPRSPIFERFQNSAARLAQPEWDSMTSNPNKGNVVTKKVTDQYP